jgi:hypothetical protein
MASAEFNKMLDIIGPRNTKEAGFYDTYKAEAQQHESQSTTFPLDGM